MIYYQLCSRGATNRGRFLFAEALVLGRPHRPYGKKSIGNGQPGQRDPSCTATVAALHRNAIEHPTQPA